MFLLFGFVLAVLVMPLVLFVLAARLLGARVIGRRSTRLIVVAAIAAAVLGLASGWHAALIGVAAIMLEQTWRERRSARFSRGRANPWLRQVQTRADLASSALDIAWSRAALAARGDPRIAAARARCAALLVHAQAEPDDAALADWAEVIRRRVPELVDAAHAAAAEVQSGERAALAGELAEALAQVGAEADARLGARRLAARDRFDTLRGYVRSRTASERDWL